MNTDLNIKKIVNVYHYKTDDWHRDFFAPRMYDGIVLFTEGEIEYTLPDKKLVAKKGDFLFLPGKIPNSGKRRSQTVAFFVLDMICFSDEEFEQTVSAGVHPAADYERMYFAFSELVDSWNRQEFHTTFKLKSFIYKVLADTIAAPPRQNTTQPLDKILLYIHENIADPTLSVEKLTEIFYISESQLRRNIFKHTGMNPNGYILKLRLNKAQNELTFTNKSIGDISAECGFSSPYYFSRCFSGHYGISPLKYRTLTRI